MSRLLLALVLAAVALPSFAQLSATETILAALRAKGYQILIEERTWLGRGRIVAENGQLRRELVFNPGTGEIFRDFSTRLNDDRGGGAAVAAAMGEPPAVGGVGAATSADSMIRSEEVLPDPVVTLSPGATE